MKSQEIDLGERDVFTKPIRVNVTNVSDEPMEVHVHVRGHVIIEGPPVSDEELARQVRESLRKVSQ